MQPTRKSPAGAFTLVEMLVVIACTALVRAILLSAQLAEVKPRSARITCVNNLKQIGLAFKDWALDNMNKFPMEVAVTNGGTFGVSQSDLIWRSFQVMSNELSTPKILVCPQDVRAFATNFGPDFFNANISYFIGLRANETTPKMLLSGDRNLTNGTPLQNGILEVTPSHPPGWTRAIHKSQGNILFADGSVQQLSSDSLHRMVIKIGETNHLAIP